MEQVLASFVHFSRYQPVPVLVVSPPRPLLPPTQEVRKQPPAGLRMIRPAHHVAHAAHASFMHQCLLDLMPPPVGCCLWRQHGANLLSDPPSLLFSPHHDQVATTGAHVKPTVSDADDLCAGSPVGALPAVRAHGPRPTADAALRTRPDPQRDLCRADDAHLADDVRDPSCAVALGLPCVCHGAVARV